ncbi:hypothetical protein CAPTEDRAFT_222074 [Capitella teleta]|uniref:KICSTOR complex protein SZT2 n=1 Tax=Capitella teleta TaxID=283909 RepID=R7T553_CAPTE|nr:hypothetical protein CAPTEDRAFT_222074 [Capitella teleta]|eukprot:ELT88148.1 hypothetical protein CAPTEDRAFT_222074 [Capitella teleta]
MSKILIPHQLDNNITSELKDCLGDLSAEVNLNECYITLDMICLTLPPEDNLMEATARPCYERMTSIVSQISFSSHADDTDLDAASTTDVGGLSRQASEVPSSIPKPQLGALNACKEQIKWLMTDEMVSALRLTTPVTEETLEMVAEHVKNSLPRDNWASVLDHVYLKFVYGPEQSLTHFIEEFERMNLPGYHLNKEGRFYYLYIDRAHATSMVTMAHQREISNALMCLENDTYLTQEAVLLPSEIISPAHVRAEAEPPPQLTQDASVVVLSTLVDDGDAAVGDGFRAEDIKISVIRPSPVKEVPKDRIELDFEAQEQQEDRVHMNFRDDHISDRSSGSSIQVIEEKEGDEGLSFTARPDLQRQEALPEIYESDPVPSLMDEVFRENIDAECSTTKDTEPSKGRSFEGDLPREEEQPKQQLQQLNRPADKGAIVIKKAQSSGSFEKYKSERPKLFQTASTVEVSSSNASGTMTPNRRSSLGLYTPKPSIASGLNTPLSTIGTQSRCSGCFDDGYEGDSSDSDEDGVMMSFSESAVQRPVLPNFWLAMCITEGLVDVYFHTRDYHLTHSDTDNHCNSENIHQRELYNMVITNITQTCRIVNQRLLLEELYATRMCNSLLVPEAEEDLQWTGDMSNKHRHKLHDSDDSDNEAPQNRYLAATMQFIPGHFACDCIWTEHFLIHPRLKVTAPRTGTTHGIQTLRSVLNKFSVNNRKNMFVVKENNGAVFYLSLSEYNGDSFNPPSAAEFKPEDDPAWLTFSRSSSVISMSLRRGTDLEEESSAFQVVNPSKKTSNASAYDIPDTDSMTSSRLLMSQSSTNSIRAAKSEDYVTLSAHGVVPVGPEISDDLVQLLQRKLDDAVLEILTLTLSRNPMCKLTAEDIVFIQRPNTAPSRIFKLTIPPSALLQQSALGYYLRQNLLHFVFTPKYMDSSHVFCHYDGHGAAKPVPEEDIFLYNRSQQAGGKVGGSSIACVLLSFVDGCGNPVVLLSSPKPSPSAYKEPLDAAMFDSLVHVDPFVEKGRGPGPMALVQFCIWERGQVDLDQLCELLKQAMRHAVCDVITEFRMLTVPLCKVPPHSARGIESPLPSAPSSPSFCLKQDSETKGSGLHSEAAIKKQHSEGGRTPKEKSSFGAFMSDIFKTNKTASLGTPKEELNADDLSANTLSAPPSAMQEMESQWKNKIEVQQNIERYENGEKGHMHSFLQTTLREWLDFCHATGCPTVAKSSYTLHSRFPVDYVLKDLHSNVASICSDVSLRIFKRMQTLHSDSDPIFFPYSVPIKHNNKDRPDSADLSSFAGSVHIPGKTNEYVVVCRNIGQWRGSMESPSLLKDFTEHLPSAPKSAGPQKVKNFKTYYRFHPLESSNETKRPEAGGVASGDCMDNAFVPRQRLLLLFIEDKQLTAYYYNWSGETHSSLEKQLNATINWHNARWHLMSWIICQKSGLFDHCTFGDMPGEDSPQPVQSMSEIDSLVKCTSPPTAAQVSRVRHRSGNLIQRMLGPGAHVPHHLNAGNPFQSPGLMLCRMYQDIKPPSAMHRSSYAKMKDPLHRHGAQFMEMRALERRENEKRNALENLYMTWQQRVSNPPITDDDLELLKNSSRLIHSVASPLLFTPAWRRKALGKMDAPKRRDPPEPPKSRSRHGSGASVKSKRSDSFDMRTKKLSGGGHTPDSPDVSAHEERWHSDLKTEFVGQYMQYLQGLGFAQVQVRAAETKKSYARSPRASTEKRAHYYNFHPKSCNTYLQKTFPGGIMLIEIGFQEVYFSIHVYALECSRLPVGKNVNTSLAHIFTDECDKFKDLTHVHSFTHDFHLRVVQTFLSSPLHPIVMKQGYHITAFLSDFVKHYSFAPGFARNCIIEGSVTVHNTNSSGQQLFDYMLQHADKLYRMKSVRMSPCPYEEEWDADNDCALVLQFEPRKLHKKTDGSDASESETLDHDIGLIICHDSQSKASSANSLRLRFWLILTNRFDRFPKDQLEKRLGMFKSSHTFPATSQFLLSTSDPGDDLEDVHRGKRFQLTVVKFDGQEITKLLVTLESGEGNFDQIPAVHQHINIRPELAQARQESTNYLGYSNAHQTPIFNLLKEEAKRVRMMIHSMVQETMSRCRRDLLWQRMLLSNVADEEEKRRKHRGSDEDSRDSLMSKLTFPEFEELLKIVVSVSLDQIDYRLGILLNMNAPWYQGLIRVLTQRYRDEHRLFSSPDGITQHLVVLNPNHLDMLLLLTINSTTGLQNLCAVHRETENEEVDDMPSLTALATQNHVESFVNACCFHMWASML